MNLQKSAEPNFIFKGSTKTDPLSVEPLSGLQCNDLSIFSSWRDIRQRSQNQESLRIGTDQTLKPKGNSEVGEEGEAKDSPLLTDLAGKRFV